VSRPTSLSGQRAGSTSAVTLEAFKYLGAGTVIERSRPEVNVTLSMVNFSNATGDAGDKYTGLDRFGRVVDQRWTQGTTATSPVVDRYGHTYDSNSNRLTRSNALAAAFSETYAYDALNQLSSFNRSGGATTSQQWQFDALGNWTTVTTNGVAENRTANAQNEFTQVGGSSLAYSPTGNLTTDAQGRTLAYDAWNRLVSVADTSGTEVARYGYDGLNRRIIEQVGTLASPAAATAAIRDIYYSQDWQALEERVRTSPSQVATTADTRFIWSPVYVDAMVARDRNADGNGTTGTGGLEQRVYALQDANWNTTAIIAATGVSGVAAGAVINRFAYTPYGEVQTLTASWTSLPAGSTPAVPWAHLFQGLEFTDVTALAYVRHRDYSATLGRFIEMDPIGFDAGDNNWYRFVANEPTGSVDPLGLECTTFQRRLNLDNPRYRFDVGVANGFGLRMSGRIKGELSIQGQECQVCCPNGSEGKTTTVQVRGRIGVSFSVVAGWNWNVSWGGGAISAYLGFKGEAYWYSEISAESQTTTCNPKNQTIRVCGVADARFRLYGGGQARFQYGAWSYDVGAQVYGEATFNGLGWCVLLDSKGNFKGFETNRPGTFDINSLMAEVCVGGCMTWKLW
jgi:RHS repeat-associated protein